MLTVWKMFSYLLTKSPYDACSASKWGSGIKKGHTELRYFYSESCNEAS